MMKVLFVNNAFSTKMLQKASHFRIDFDFISEEDFRDAITKTEKQNIIIGHDDTAKYFEVEFNRQTLHLQKGDVLFICEANSKTGGRLPSGTEFLSQMGEGFFFRFIRIEIVEQK